VPFFLGQLGGLQPRALNPLEERALEWASDHPYSLRNRAIKFSDVPGRTGLPDDEYDESFGRRSFDELLEEFPSLLRPADYWTMQASEFVLLRIILDRRRIPRAVDAYLKWRENYDRWLADKARNAQGAGPQPEY
jgi:hypothetical protein